MSFSNWLIINILKRQATHIAPLQPPILAAFRPWGGSAGAGRVRPAGREDIVFYYCFQADLQISGLAD